jgi:hypothetical protein
MQRDWLDAWKKMVELQKKYPQKLRAIGKSSRPEME